MMDRRKFIKEGIINVSFLTIGSGILLACSKSEKMAFNEVLSLAEVDLINELGNVIIPATDTPGAKDAQVGEFIGIIVQDCYSKEDKLKFKSRLKDVNILSKQNYGQSFLDCNDHERRELVSKMETDHEGYKSIKGLIVNAYLSSEIGMTQFFTYYPVPGQYDGCSSIPFW